MTNISMEELSTTEAWRSLGPNLKRLLTLALESRNLPVVIREFYPALDSETQRLLSENLQLTPAVRRVIDLYALGVAAKTPSDTTDISTTPVLNASGENLLTPSTDAPTVEGEVFSDTAN
jgi:hypothetical protein